MEKNNKVDSTILNEFKLLKDIHTDDSDYKISIPKDKKGKLPFSTDANLLHTSSEGKVLEDPWKSPLISGLVNFEALEKATS